jgi:hypothetical protein
MRGPLHSPTWQLHRSNSQDGRIIYIAQTGTIIHHALVGREDVSDPEGWVFGRRTQHSLEGGDVTDVFMEGLGTMSNATRFK